VVVEDDEEDDEFLKHDIKKMMKMINFVV